MQQIYVIEPFNQGSPHFEIIGMIGDYYSMLWHVQLYGLGYFEITLPATQNTVRLVTDMKVGSWFGNAIFPNLTGRRSSELHDHPERDHSI